MLFSFAGYLGVNCVLDLVRHFGALIAVTGSFETITLASFLNKIHSFLVTTFRKTITIILSFIAFTKPFTFQ